MPRNASILLWAAFGLVVAGASQRASGQEAVAPAALVPSAGYPVTPQTAIPAAAYPVTPYGATASGRGVAEAGDATAADPVAAAQEGAGREQPLYPQEPLAYAPPVAVSAADAALASATPLAGAQLLARVGGTAILQSDVEPIVAKLLELNKQQLQFDRLSPADRQAAHQILTRKAVEYMIDSKLTLEDARRTVPEENFKKIQNDVADHFEKKVLPMVMKRDGYQSREEMEAGLRAKGSSYEQEKRNFVEQYVADTWKKQSVKVPQEVTHEESVAWYQEHIAEYTHEARARWEELVVRKAKHADPGEARDKLAAMGNRVLGGEPLAAVAKAESEGPTASSGGTRDWTTQGSLVSKVLDEVLFGLPVGQLSQIIEDDQGFYIVRVVERKDAGQTPFTEAQAEIRRKIREARRIKAEEAYVARLRDEIPVWTVYDSLPGGPAATN